MKKKWYIFLRQIHPIELKKWEIYRPLTDEECKNIKEIKRIWYRDCSGIADTSKKFDYECKILEMYDYDS